MITNKKINTSISLTKKYNQNIPQGCLLHSIPAFVSTVARVLASVKHKFPPLGVGKLHSRFTVITPPPQVTLHSVMIDQALHPPFRILSTNRNYLLFR